mgnify:CR=1 FL=1
MHINSLSLIMSTTTESTRSWKHRGAKTHLFARFAICPRHIECTVLLSCHAKSVEEHAFECDLARFKQNRWARAKPTSRASCRRVLRLVKLRFGLCFQCNTGTCTSKRDENTQTKLRRSKKSQSIQQQLDVNNVKLPATIQQQHHIKHDNDQPRWK